MRFLSSLGGIVNDITGATSAAAKSQKYALQSAAVNNKYQKEFAQNAHQWEVADLEAAGLNPILSAGGGGATASGGGVNSAQMASGGISPGDLINTGINTVNGIQTAKKTASETDNINADTALKQAQTLIAGIEFDIKSGTSKTEIDRKKAELNKLLEEIKLIKQGGIGKTLGTELTEIGTEIIKEQADPLIEKWKKAYQKRRNERLNNVK